MIFCLGDILTGRHNVGVLRSEWFIQSFNVIKTNEGNIYFNNK